MKSRMLVSLTGALMLFPAASELSAQQEESYVGKKVRRTVRAAFGEPARVVRTLTAAGRDTVWLRTKKDDRTGRSPPTGSRGFRWQTVGNGGAGREL
ncbi:MAG: hypothetical protein ACE5HP_12295 [Gemmatimonadota bacterium]